MRYFPLILVIIIFNIYGEFNQINALKAFFWYKSDEDTVKHGCYGYVNIDSVSSSEEEDLYYASFWLTYEWWFLKFKGTYTPAKIIIRKSKPFDVTRGSNHFNNQEWFSGFKVSETNDSIRFYFPLMSTGSKYGRYDYFTVDVDSTLDLEFYGAGDSVMVGTFVHKKPDERGAVNILGRNAIIVEITDSNPLRVSSVRCRGSLDSLLTLFFGFSLDTFKADQDWYGFDILDTISNAPMISINSIDIEGPTPFRRGTERDIIWSVDNKEYVDSFIVSISYDKMDWKWDRIGNAYTDTSLAWIIDTRASETSVIEVLAFGKNGERIYSTVDNFNFTSVAIIPRYLRLLIN